MALLGSAALAMWWSIAPDVREDFEHWHAHEHFPERLSIPGFLRASRWRQQDGRDAGDGMFVLYELESHAVLSSAAYAARLNAPSAWSTRLMPHHRAMVRTQCRVLASHGFGLARFAATLRLTPAPGRADELRESLDALGAAARGTPGLVGLHLLRHEAPTLAPTVEQKLRGLADAGADHVVVVTAYDDAALDDYSANAFGDAALSALGARAGADGDVVRGRWTLAASATPGDLA